jgi:hypothetical protein
MDMHASLIKQEKCIVGKKSAKHKMSNAPESESDSEIAINFISKKKKGLAKTYC